MNRNIMANNAWAGREMRRGFALVELLVVVAALMAFTVLAGQLYTSILRTLRQTEKATDRTITFDRMLNELQRDAWSATDVDVDGDGVLHLDQPQGKVSWRPGAEGASMTRVAMGEGDAMGMTFWSDLPPGLGFESDGNGRMVILATDPMGDRPGERVSLICPTWRDRRPEGAR